MAVIYKYEIESFAPMRLPVGARILSVATQNGQPYLWALVDVIAPMESRKIALIPTGAPLPPGVEAWEYIGTVHGVEGSLVFHVFDREEDHG